MTLALQMLRVREVYDRMDPATRDSDLRRAKELIAVSDALEEAHIHVRELRTLLHVVVPILGASRERRDAMLHQKVHQQVVLMAQTAKKFGKVLSRIPYPFPHHQGKLTAARYVLQKQGRINDPESVVRVAAEALTRYESLLFRVIASLSNIAEKVESRLGYAPFEPPEETDSLEMFVQECELAAAQPRTWQDGASNVLRWLCQIGVTVGLCLALFVAFLVVSALVRWQSNLVEKASQRGVAAKPPAATATATKNVSPPLMPPSKPQPAPLQSTPPQIAPPQITPRVTNTSKPIEDWSQPTDYLKEQGYSFVIVEVNGYDGRYSQRVAAKVACEQAGWPHHLAYCRDGNLYFPFRFNGILTTGTLRSRLIANGFDVARTRFTQNLPD